MLRKAGLATALLLALPAFANAWTLTAKIGSGQGSITAAKGEGTVAFNTYSSGTDNLYNITKTGAPITGYFKVPGTSQTVTFVPATGNKVVAVYLDGVSALSQVASDGTLTVTDAALKPKNHSLLVYYSQIAASSVTVTQTTGGTVAVQHLTDDPAKGGKPNGAYSRNGFTGVRAGAWIRVYALPNSDSKVLAGNGFAAGEKGEVLYQDVQVSEGVTNVTANFATVASISPNLIALDAATNRIQTVFQTGSTINLVASAIANTAVNYSWSGCGASDVNAKTNTITAPAANCSVTVTIAAADGSLTKTATLPLTIVSKAQTANNVCLGCHQQRNPDVVAAFNGSAHWNSVNNGPPDVISHGLNCSQTCHFKSVEQPGCATCHSGQLQANGTLAHYSTTHGDILANKATAQNTCFICHSGDRHGTQPKNFLNGAHNTGAHAKLYYNMDQRACLACHDEHSTVATFDGCNTCHKPGTNYSIYADAAGTILKKLHGNQNRVAAVKTGSTNKGWYGGNRYVLANMTTSFVSPADSCSNCHGHNNSVNGQYGENYHSKNNRWKTSTTRAWKYQGYSTAAKPAEVSTDGCVRCHSTTGYVNFVASNFQDLRAWGYQEAGYVEANTAAEAANTNTVSEAVTCRACHTDAEGHVRVVPAAQAYYNVTTVPFGKINSQMVQYSDFKNSNVCIPCHMGRNGANDGKSIDTVAAGIAAQAAATTLTVNGAKVDFSSVPHGVNQAGVLDAKMGYTFGKTFANVSTGHATIGVGGDKPTNTVSGPCVTCHMSNDGGFRNHTFDVVVDGKTPTVCATCHGPNFNADSITKAEESFNASLKALAEVLGDEKLTFTGTPIFAYDPTLSHGAPIGMSWANTTAGGPGANSAGQTYDFAGKPAELAKVIGAVYNYNLLKNDVGAFAHNPAYTKWLIAESINAVRATGATVSGITTSATTSAADAIAKLTPNGRISSTEILEASEFLNDRHYAATNGSAYKVQYLVSGSTTGNAIVCATCHNPAESALQAEARVAWSESGHGETTALPWMPSAKHLWRSAGIAASYADAASGDDCVRCHTAEGFAQFAGSNFTNVNPVAAAADAATNSPLACNTCHANGLTADSARLAVPTVTIYYNISTANVAKTHLAATYPDAGESNMCIPCHAARISGAALADAAAKGMDFNTNGFQNSHYMGAAGLMYVKAGFTAFTTASTQVAGTTVSYGQTLTAETDNTVDVNGAVVIGKLTSTHRKLGTTAIRGDKHNAAFFVAGNLDTNGPCVTCHLQGYNNAGTKRPGAGHSLAIDDAAWNQVCTNCHSSEGLLMIEEQKEPYQAMMNVLKALVESKLNVDYNSSSYPYFYQKGTTTAFKAFGNVKNEGAAFNLNLLTREPASYIHARTYVRRLIYDTIDYLDDNQMNQSVKTYLEGLTTFGNRPADASGTTANDAVWQYIQGYDRTTKAWTASERP